MNKYLHFVFLNKSIFIFHFFLLSNFTITTICSQNIRLKVDVKAWQIFDNRNFSLQGSGCIDEQDDCGSFANNQDSHIKGRLVINGITYDLSEGHDDFFWINPSPCNKGWYILNTPMNWYTSSLIGIPKNSTFEILIDGYEDDNFVCGGNDAACGGYKSLLYTNNITQDFSYCRDSVKLTTYCISDDEGANWGVDVKISWIWASLIPDNIDAVKNICIGDNYFDVNTITNGTQEATNLWELSNNGLDWYSSGNSGSTENIHNLNMTPTTFYVRKVKKGLGCSSFLSLPGYSTILDVYSNVCTVNVLAQPTTVPTAIKVPNKLSTCQASLSNLIDPFNGTIPFVWEFQTSYDGGLNWSAIQNTVPSLYNNTNVVIPDARIRLRANYNIATGCNDSPWNEYSWSLFAAATAPSAINIYTAMPNYTCTIDSMYIEFGSGSGGGPFAFDEFEYTTNGGTTWLPYTNGQRIRTITGAGLSYGIRARRTCNILTSATLGCISSPYTIYGFWEPYEVATAPALITKNPNSDICTGLNVNASATILPGSFGTPGNTTNVYQYSIDGGGSWLSYTSGQIINTATATNSVLVRGRRIDNNPTPTSEGSCSSNWIIVAKWNVIVPKNYFSFTSTFCYYKGKPIVQLIANNPAPGVGTWSIVSGPGSITNPSFLSTDLINLTIGTPTRIRWSVTEGLCNISRDTIITPVSVSLTDLTNGNECQICSIFDDTKYVFYDNTGKLMSAIQDLITPISELGLTEVCVGIDSVVKHVTTNYGILQPYLQRHFSIYPVTNTNSLVTLYFTSAEFNNLKSACNGTNYAFTNVSELIVSKFPGGKSKTYTLPNTPGGIYIIPTASGIDVNGNYFITIPVSTFSTFYIHSNYGAPTVLPVELAYFTASCEGYSIKINWQTISENNNHHFEIERSENAIDFTTILNVPTQNGNSNQLQNYLVYDNEPINSVLYYRLKQVDIDGKITYSKVIDINCKKSMEINTIVSVYPNPTDDILNIAINSNENRTAVVKVFDVNTNLVFQKEINISTGNNLFDISTQNISSGFYIIEIVEDSVVLYKNKIVKQ